MNESRSLNTESPGAAPAVDQLIHTPQQSQQLRQELAAARQQSRWEEEDDAELVALTSHGSPALQQYLPSPDRQPLQAGGGEGAGQQPPMARRIDFTDEAAALTQLSALTPPPIDVPPIDTWTLGGEGPAAMPTPRAPAPDPMADPAQFSPAEGLHQGNRGQATDVRRPAAALPDRSGSAAAAAGTEDRTAGGGGEAGLTAPEQPEDEAARAPPTQEIPPSRRTLFGAVHSTENSGQSKGEAHLMVVATRSTKDNRATGAEAQDGQAEEGNAPEASAPTGSAAQRAADAAIPPPTAAPASEADTEPQDRDQPEDGLATWGPTAAELAASGHAVAQRDRRPPGQRRDGDLQQADAAAETVRPRGQATSAVTASARDPPVSREAPSQTTETRAEDEWDADEEEMEVEGEGQDAPPAPRGQERAPVRLTWSSGASIPPPTPQQAGGSQPSRPRPSPLVDEDRRPGAERTEGRAGVAPAAAYRPPRARRIAPPQRQRSGGQAPPAEDERDRALLGEEPPARQVSPPAPGAAARAAAGPGQGREARPGPTGPAGEDRASRLSGADVPQSGASRHDESDVHRDVHTDINVHDRDRETQDEFSRDEGDGRRLAWARGVEERPDVDRRPAAAAAAAGEDRGRGDPPDGPPPGPNGLSAEALAAISGAVAQAA
eukprot:SAG22_NODE_2103_length_3009_cov_6.486254_3_plen_664_part_00